MNQQKQLHINNLRGVDYYNTAVNVKANRAADMVNFTVEDGRHKKRNGWEQVIKKIPGRINMIYPYNRAGETEILVYAGKTFYRITKAAPRSESDYIVEKIDAWDVTKHEDRRCQAFEQNGVIYIVGCGPFLRYKRGEKPLEMREITGYIPTTTIDINAEGLEVVRSTLEPVNLLTRKRKNTLVGAGENSTWKLDSSVNTRSNITVEYVRESKDDSHNVDKKKITLTNKAGIGLYDEGDVPRGSVTFLGEITLNFDTTPMEGGTRNNITVTFTADIEDHSDMITNCTFGTLFGVGGAADRLFLSGNPAYKNVEWFSEADNFEYFPDQYTAVFGTDTQPITAFSRLNDNTLAVFKATSHGAPSIYYQTGEYRTTYDDNGDVDKITPVFSITAGASEESAINQFCCANLHGDDLILSKNGVFGISLLQNVQTDAHVTSAKSLAINNLLRKTNLASAAGIAYRDKYYLSAGGKCFVADYNYRYTMKGSDDVQYEWFVWDNINAHTWAIVGDELWFGTTEGRICRFAERYTDQVFGCGESGDFAINYDQNCITYNSKIDYHPDPDDLIRIRTDGAFAKILYSSEFHKEADKPVFVVNNGTAYDLEVYEGFPIFYVDDGTVKGPYRIKVISTLEFIITDENGNNQAGYFLGHGDIIISISWVDLYVSKLIQYETESGDPANGFSLKISKSSTKDLILYDAVFREEGEDIATVATNPQVYIYHLETVSARWITPVFDMGSNGVSKTLYNLCISMNPESRGKIRFGYSTRNGTGERSLVSASQWDLAKTDFSFFSFEPSSWLSYTAKVKVPRFNYIQFWFEHNTPEDCSINDFTATYTLVARNMGVR